MKISRLRVGIGDHEQTVENCTDQDPDVAGLMQMANSSNAVITIDVPQSPEGAAALGRLVFGKRNVNTIGVASVADQLPTLSKKIAELNLSGRLAHCFKNANFKYVCQVVEKPESELLKIKNFGRLSLEETRSVFEKLGLKLSTDLSSIKDRLPT